LEELAHTPVTVVCAGAKAVLDLSKTLEYLETKGVPVIGYGTDHFPAFWSRTSGLAAPIRLDTPEGVADLVRTKRQLGLRGGVLVANPIPADDEIEIDRHIEAALEEAARRGVSGKAVTPFLLAHILETTGGRSLSSNIALVRNNAALAAEIAGALGP
jgi:pseudouridylate synthase